VAQRKHTSKDHYARELDRRRSEEVCQELPFLMKSQGVSACPRRPPQGSRATSTNWTGAWRP